MIYDMEMEKYVHLQPAGAKAPVIIIKGDQVEDMANVKLVVKSGNKQVGEFNKDQVASWSIHADSAE